MNSVFIYDAFTSTKFGGNQAGIVFQDEALPREEKQALAKELHFSETVFVSRGKEGAWKLEYFTPKEEVELCGHATIAAIYALFDEGYLGTEKEVKIETSLALLSVYLEREGEKLSAVWMEQDAGQMTKEISLAIEDILAALSLKASDLREDLPVFKAYSGLWDLMLPLKTKKALLSIEMDEKAVTAASSALSVISFHPFYLEGKKAYVRNFAPIVEIPEEAATGTSNGALAFALEQLGVLEKEESLQCYQGESMQRPSQILAKIRKDGRILVGGQAVRVLKGVY